MHSSSVWCAVLLVIGLVVGLGLWTPVHAAVVFDAASASLTAGATSLTFSHTTGGGSNTVMIVGFINANVSVTDVTYNSVSLTPIDSCTYNFSTSKVHLYRLIAPTAGTHDVKITVGSSSRIYAVATTYTGVHQTTPVGTPVKNCVNTADNGPVTVDVTSVASGEMVVDFASVNNANVVPTVGADQTVREDADDTGSSGNWAGSSTETGTGTITMSWSLNQTPKTWGTVAVAIKVAAAASGGACVVGSGLVCS
jgi:hypothetical protein